MTTTVRTYDAPLVTVLSAPPFTEAPHLLVKWGAELVPATAHERLIEYAGRLCYMSQANPANRSTAAYLANVMDMGHGSVLEHGQLVFLLEGVSRSLTHELIRHRVGTAVSQLSQRYVDAAGTAFVVPPMVLAYPETRARWEAQCRAALECYTDLVQCWEEPTVLPELLPTMRRKRAREAARSVLPNCTETKLVWSCNLRELRHVLRLRGDLAADWEIRRWALALWTAALPYAPSVLGDISLDHDNDTLVFGRDGI